MANFPFRPAVEQLGSLSAAVARSPTSNNNFAPMTPHIWPSMTVLRISIRLPDQIAGGEVLLRMASQLPKSLLGVGLLQADREFTGIARLFYYGTIAQMERYLRELGYVSASSKLPSIFIKPALRRPNNAVRARRAEKNTHRQRP